MNQQDRNGQTPIHFAAAHSNVALARAIVESGADLSIKDAHGNTPLWTAVFNAKGHYDIVETLVKNGADADTKNNAGKSPLAFARQIHDERLLSLLSRDGT